MTWTPNGLANFLFRILKFKQTLLPSLYLGGFPPLEWDPHYVRTERDLKEHQWTSSSLRWRTDTEEKWKFAEGHTTTWWLEQLKALWLRMPGPHLWHFHHIQLLTFIQRTEDSRPTLISSHELIQGAKTSLNLSSVSVALTSKWTESKAVVDNIVLYAISS